MFNCPITQKPDNLDTMTSYDYLILGAGIAGTRAAEAIRNNNPKSSIAIFTDEKYPLYSRILLPQYLRNQIPREKLFLRKLEDYQSKNIGLFFGKTASKVDDKARKVIFTDQTEVEFKKLLIATGGSLNKWQVKGSETENVLMFRTIDDADKIKKVMSQSQNGVVVGGGFIGIELSESFVINKIKTTFLIREPWFWEMFLDKESGELIQDILSKNGVEISTNEEVVEVLGKNGKVSGVKTNKGREFPADIIGVGIGISPDMNMLTGSGIEINRGIVVNEYLETTTPGIFAAGDIAEFHDVIFNRHHQLGNWANASTQGNVVGANMSGQKTIFQTVSAYTITLFSNTFTMIGETDPKQAEKIIIRGSSKDRKLGRIFLSQNKIIGATLINLAFEQSILTSLIREKKEIGEPEKLADLEFELKNLQ